MAKTGTAQAKIGLDYSNFERGSRAVIRLNSIMANAVSSALGNVAATAFSTAIRGASDFLGSIKGNVEETFKLGEAMANMSHATGLAAGQYAAFKLAQEKGITNQEAARIIGNNAELLGRNADTFRDISIKFAAVGQRIEGFWLGVAERVAPVLNPLLDKLAKLDLSSYGQAFAQPIADGVRVIIQLAEDGELWSTMGQLIQAAIVGAAQGFVWLADIAGKLLDVAVTGGFDRALGEMWSAWVNFVTPLGDLLGETLFGVITDIQERLNQILDAGNAFAQKFGFGDDNLVKAAKAARDQDIADQRAAQGAARSAGYKPESGASIKEILEGVLKDTPFDPSGSFSTLSANISAKFAEALSKYGADPANNNPDKFRNVSAVQNFGVDSLQAAGGGGGIGGGVGLIDYAARQTDYQRDMLDQLRQINARSTAAPLTVGFNPVNGTDGVSIGVNPFS